MARGQDAPMQTGGKIDPYVAQSVAQGRQGAENKLLTAMQNKAAMERTQVQEAGATARTGMQVGAQERVQAAQLEAQDRRAAEAERGRRETNEWNAAQNEITRRLEKEMEDNRLNQREAFHKDDLDRLDKADKRAASLAKLRMAWEKWQADLTQSSTIKMLEMQAGDKAREEKMVTELTRQKEESEQASKAYQTMVDRAADRTSSSLALDFPKGAAWQAPNRALARVFSDVEDGSGVTFEDLQSPGMIKLRSKIVQGNVSAGDVNLLRGKIDGITRDLQDRADKEENEVKRAYLRTVKSAVLDLKFKLDNLKGDKAPIGDSKRTVGMVIRMGFGDADGTSLGARVRAAQEQGQSIQDYIAFMKQPRNPFSIPDDFDLDDPYVAEFANTMQTLYGKAQANVDGVAWGAD